MEGQDCCNRHEADSVQRMISLRRRLIGRSITRELDRRHACRNRNPPSLYDCHRSVLHVGSQPRPRNTATARR